MKERKDPKSRAQTFTWRGKNKRGEISEGTVQATSLALAKASLRQQGIQPTRVRKKTASLLGERKKPIKLHDIAVFSRQLATMLSAGIPLLQSFDIVGRGHSNPSMEELIFTIKHHVASGSSLAEALGQHPQYFNGLYCNLVSAGERSGSLEGMLSRVASYQEKMESIRGKVKKALVYPTVVLTVAFAVTAGLMIWVVPQFESLFKGFGADLPAATQVVVSISKFFQSYWWLMLFAIISSILAFTYARQHSEPFNRYLDRLLLRLPILGSIFEKAVIARFSRTLGITFSAGMPLVDALDAVAGTAGNRIYAEAIRQVKQDVSSGQALQEGLTKTGLFPPMVLQMVAIGEESGALEKMLSRIADFYEEEVDNAVDNLSSLLEPFILVFLAVLVGGIVIAMYLPIFMLGQVV